MAKGGWVVMVKIKRKKKLESFLFPSKKAAHGFQGDVLRKGAVDCASVPFPFKEKDWVCR